MIRSTPISLLTLAAGVLAITVATPATAQTAAAKSPPTAADWAALAKLPDFTGVWEIWIDVAGDNGKVETWASKA